MGGKGRKRLDNKLIESSSARMVTFSKRRKGLFKKVEELTVLSGAKVVALAFSQARRSYCLDTETLDSILCPQTQPESLLCPPLGIFADKKTDECWEFDFNETVAGNSLPFWYNKSNIRSMDCEELDRLENAILKYGRMQLAKYS